MTKSGTFVGVGVGKEIVSFSVSSSREGVVDTAVGIVGRVGKDVTSSVESVDRRALAVHFKFTKTWVCAFIPRDKGASRH